MDKLQGERAMVNKKYTISLPAAVFVHPGAVGYVGIVKNGVEGWEMW